MVGNDQNTYTQSSYNVGYPLPVTGAQVWYLSLSLFHRDN
jgi:hypothetical protein